MWTHGPWQGRFLPHPLPPAERLRAYATWCNAVEGNTTFYATPARSTVETWAAQTAPGFRFVVKLPKTITHERRLSGADEPLREFLDAIEPLGPRTHALWIQLPGSFGPGDLGTLAGFLHRLPQSYRYAVEVRHKAFFEDARAVRSLEGVLGRAGAEWVPFDTVTLFETPLSHRRRARRLGEEAAGAAPVGRAHGPADRALPGPRRRRPYGGGVGPLGGRGDGVAA
ncbi:DUF72 domain-containing protein [Nonomuraea ferruginea]